MTPEMCSLQQLVIAKLNDLPPAEKKARVTRRAILPEIEEFTVNLNGNFVNAVNAVVDFVSDREDPLATQHATASYAEIISQNTAVAISEEDLINELCNIRK
uniref:Uncharacterized protein n=1 Tax=Ditylenchus dipsaci TaxID=166011 RepID=A0A915DT08_9BILA